VEKPVHNLTRGRVVSYVYIHVPFLTHMNNVNVLSHELCNSVVTDMRKTVRNTMYYNVLIIHDMYYVIVVSWRVLAVQITRVSKNTVQVWIIDYSISIVVDGWCTIICRPRGKVHIVHHTVTLHELVAYRGTLYYTIDYAFAFYVLVLTSICAFGIIMCSFFFKFC
jgi:hypothetical protein